MKRPKKGFGVAVLAVVFLLMAASLSFAADVTVDFSQLIPFCDGTVLPCEGQAADHLTSGSLSCADTTCTDATTGLMATGYSFVQGGYAVSPLWVRNTSYGNPINANDKGLGVCSEGDALCNGSGDFNELSNKVGQELIVLTLPDGFDWKEVLLSSLDPNTGETPPVDIERGLLFAGNDIASALANVPIAKFDGNGGGTTANIDVNEWRIDIPAANATSKVLVFQPIDWKNGTNTNNDFLVRAAVLTQVEEGCTLTQGYWKTHYTGKKADPTWNDLGGGLGADTPFFLSGKSYIEVLKTAPMGNAYYILAHQYIAAVLNMLSGASSTPEVDDAIAWAETFFSTHLPSDKLPKADRNEAIDNADVLTDYNEGAIGPGHCPD